MKAKLWGLGALLLAGLAVAQTYSQFSYLRVLNILDVRTSIQNQDAAENVVIDDNATVTGTLGVTGALTVASCSGCGSGTPGGSNTQVQFNDSSAFGGDSGLVFDKTTDALTVGGTTTINNTGPVLRWIENDAAANGQRWRDYVNASVMNRCVLNDAEGVETCYFQATRSGTTVTALNLAATSVTTNSIDVTPATGEFTVTFDDACTTSPTLTVDYAKMGNIVVIHPNDWSLGGGSCTSDSTFFRESGTSVPAAIRPTTYTVLMRTGGGLQDNSVAVDGCIAITASGQFQFARFTSNICNQSGWTAGGSKAAVGAGNMSVSYMLTDP